MQNGATPKVGLQSKKRQTSDPRPRRRFDGIRFLEAASISKITGDESAL